jgi:hypothetical protein
VQNIEITYDYGDFVAVWDGWTGVFLLFSKDGERIGGFPHTWSREEAEQMLRETYGYVPDEQVVRYAGYNLFPFP